MTFTIALAGNPNAGKSTLFNALTGSHQHVGNWPGKTVAKKEGRLKIRNQEIVVVDLPGTYSLTAFSLEEVIARDFIITDSPNAVIIVVDAANLERNLYLVVQLLEMGVPLILALNMTDIAESRGIKINDPLLSQKLGGVPVVRTVGNREIGLDALKSTIVEISKRQNAPQIQIPFGSHLENEINSLAEMCSQEKHPRWLAIKLLEGDENILAQADTTLVEAAKMAVNRIQDTANEEVEILIADARYTFIGELVQEVVSRPEADVMTFSDKLDRILTHRWLGLPIFLTFMWLVFQFTANVSAPYLDWVDGVVNGLIAHRTLALTAASGLADTWFESLLVDGVIGGVGGVLTFVPVLLALYLAIAILEDTGYMARAAFVMDRLMQGLGLHGKSFLPLLVGFGCTVPAIYATRTLENETDRKITGFLATFMSCGARLPVYVIFGTAFFGTSSGNLVFAMYLTGIGVAIGTSLVLTRVAFRNKPVPPFVMELPPYRAPNVRTVLRHMWERTMGFVKKAGTVILGASIFIWLMMAIPVGEGSFNEVEAKDSLLGQTSQIAAPVFTPAGFENWESVSALVTGFVAKEIVISTMNQVYTGQVEEEESELPSFGEDVEAAGVGFKDAAILTLQEIINIIPRTVNLIPGIDMPQAELLQQEADADDTTVLGNALKNQFSVPAAVAFNIFILLYVPCMSATAAMRHEFGTRWMLLQVAYTLVVAWGAAVLVYQIGTLLS